MGVSLKTEQRQSEEKLTLPLPDHVLSVGRCSGAGPVFWSLSLNACTIAGAISVPAFVFCAQRSAGLAARPIPKTLLLLDLLHAPGLLLHTLSIVLSPRSCCKTRPGKG